VLTFHIECAASLCLFANCIDLHSSGSDEEDGSESGSEEEVITTINDAVTVIVTVCIANTSTSSTIIAAALAITVLLQCRQCLWCSNMRAVINECKYY
jgi:hypothetical protein